MPNAALLDCSSELSWCVRVRFVIRWDQRFRVLFIRNLYASLFFSSLPWSGHHRPQHRTLIRVDIGSDIESAIRGRGRLLRVDHTCVPPQKTSSHAFAPPPAPWRIISPLPSDGSDTKMTSWDTRDGVSLPGVHRWVPVARTHLAWPSPIKTKIMNEKCINVWKQVWVLFTLGSHCGGWVGLTGGCGDNAVVVVTMLLWWWQCCCGGDTAVMIMLFNDAVMTMMRCCYDFGDCAVIVTILLWLRYCLWCYCCNADFVSEDTVAVMLRSCWWHGCSKGTSVK